MSKLAPSSTPRSRLLTYLPYLVLVIATAAAFSPSLTGRMLRWDDDRLVAQNPLVGPPHVSNTLAMFTRIQNEAYQPLHVASYQIDHVLWSLHPTGCHALNIALYLASLCLLFLLFTRLGAPRWLLLASLLLFALHPTHVESVAWITGRKDVLSLLFVTLSLLLHVRSRRPLDALHIGSVILFVLAALTKTTTLILPLWILVIDRLLMDRSWREALVRAAVPAVVAGALGALVLYIWHTSGLTRELPAEGSRAVLVLRSVWHYLAATLWPAGLSPVYPIDRTGAFDARALGGLVVLPVLLAAAFWLRRKRPLASAGILLYLTALIPVMNIVPLYFQHNDRYLLLPTLGLVPVLWSIHDHVKKKHNGRAILLAATGVLCVACAIATFTYSSAWRTDLALWTHATRTQPDAYYAWMKLGETLRDQGEFQQAQKAYDRAIALQPELVPARAARLLNCLVMEQHGKAVAVETLDELSGPVGAYQQASGDSKELFILGLKLHQAGFKKCSFEVFLEAVQSEPPIPDTSIMGLAKDYHNMGRHQEACLLLTHVSEQGKKTAGFTRMNEGCDPPGAR